MPDSIIRLYYSITVSPYSGADKSSTRVAYRTQTGELRRLSYHGRRHQGMFEVSNADSNVCNERKEV